MSAMENLTICDLRPFWRGLWLRNRAEAAAAAAQFESLDVRPRNRTQQPLKEFSGGNQQKLLFGKWLRRKPVTFLLDEPTQGVDIAAKHALHAKLTDFANQGQTVLVSSTDVDELATLCTRVLVLADGVIVDEIQKAELTPGAISSSLLSGGVLI